MVWVELYSLDSTDKEKTLNWRSWNLVTNSRKFKRWGDLKRYICRTFSFDLFFFFMIFKKKYEELLKLVCFRLVRGIRCLSWTLLTTTRACLSSIKHSRCWPFWWVRIRKIQSYPENINSEVIPRKNTEVIHCKNYRGYSEKKNLGFSVKKRSFIKTNTEDITEKNTCRFRCAFKILLITFL